MADDDYSGYALAGANLLAGGVASALQYWSTRKQIKENDKWNNTQIQLANTAHQREVADLAAAGLNPVLSASSSGAGVPSLTAADIASPGEGLSRGISSAAKAWLQNRSALSQVAVNSATAANLQEQNKEIKSRIENIDADTDLKKQELSLALERLQQHRYPGFFGQGLRTLHSFTDDITPSLHSASSFGLKGWNYLKEKSSRARESISRARDRDRRLTPSQRKEREQSFRVLPFR